MLHAHKSVHSLLHRLDACCGCRALVDQALGLDLPLLLAG
jgi:hypothetical protein